MTKITLVRRILGHPIHALVANLPIGLWIASMFFDALAYDTAHLFTPKGGSSFGAREGILHTEPWPSKCAFICMALGTAFALIAAVTHFLSYLRLPDRHRAQPLAIAAMAANLAATTLFVVNAGLRWRDINRLQASGVALTLSVAGFFLALAGACLASRIVHTCAIDVEPAE